MTSIIELGIIGLINLITTGLALAINDHFVKNRFIRLFENIEKEVKKRLNGENENVKSENGIPMRPKDGC